MAEKLDGVMLVLFTYLDQRLTAKASIPAHYITGTKDPAEYAATGEHSFAVAPASEEDAAAGGARRLPPTALRNSDGHGGAREGQGQDMESVARLLQVCLGV